MHAMGMDGMEWLDCKEPFRRVIMQRVFEYCMETKMEMMGAQDPMTPNPDM